MCTWKRKFLSRRSSSASIHRSSNGTDAVIEARKTHVLPEQERNKRNDKIITLADKYGIPARNIAERLGVVAGTVHKIAREHRDAHRS